MRDILGHYFELAREAIARHGGTLEKFIGDAVMAVWGTPTSHEDDSERAVRAGLETIASVSQLAVEGNAPLKVRAAVATGEAAVSLPAAGQRLVAGDLVNTASRLQRLAEPGTLVVDGTTRQLARGAFEFEALGERRMRGKRKPMLTWRATQSHASRQPQRRGAHAGPFVGRGRELEDLERALSAGFGSRRPTFISLVGIAGIGKSRLLWELERRVARLPVSPRWLVGRASDHSDAGTFAPLREIFQQQLAVAERAALRTVRQRIRSSVEQLTSDASERAWLARGLETLLVGGDAGAGDQADLFAAWRRFLERAAGAAPTVVVVEDAQWARPEMLGFVEYIARTVSSVPLAVVTLARPELLSQRKRWLSHEQTVELHLGPISEEAMDELLATLSPELTAASRNRVRGRADGVPLYAVELVRMLLDQNALGGERLAAVIADLPPTLRALISARIDALNAEPRRTLLTASVLGSTFGRPALLALAEDRATVAGDLALLVEREFLIVERESVRFVQSLVRDVAHRTLGRRQRRAHDLAAADHYAAAGPTQIERQARHLWSAHLETRGEADAASLAGRARLVLIEAAQAAAAARAHLAELGYLNNALTLAATPTDEAELHERAGTAARLAARLGDAERHFRQAAALRVELDDQSGATRATAQLAGVLLLGQSNRPALHELERAWRSVDPRQHDSAMAELASQLARVHMILGDSQEALDWADRALALAGQTGPTAVEAQITRATALARAGDLRGLGDLRMASNAAARAGMLGAELRARNNLSWMLAADDPRASQESARQAADIAERYGSRDMAMQLLNVGAAAAVDTGDWQHVIAQLEELIAADAPDGYRIDAAVIRTLLAAVRGEDDPERHLDALGRIGREVDGQLRGVVNYARATVAFTDGRMAAALELAWRAARVGVGIDRLKALVLAGRAALWAGDTATAEKSIRALGRLEVYGRAADAARATVRAGLAIRTGQVAEATALYEEAMAAWRGLRADVQLGSCMLERACFLGRSLSEVGAARDFLGKVGANGLARLAPT